MITLLLSSSLMSLPHLVVTSQMRHSPARLLGPLVVVQGMVVIVILAGHLQSSICTCLLGAGCLLPVVVLFARSYRVGGGGRCFGQLGLFVVVWVV